MGCRGSEVRILSPRPFPSSHCRSGSRNLGLPEATKRLGLHDQRKQRPSMSNAPAIQAGVAGAVDGEVFRRLVDSVRDYAIFLLDAKGYVRTWNTGAQAI